MAPWGGGARNRLLVLLFRAIGLPDGGQNRGEQLRSRLGSPGRGEILNGDRAAATEQLSATKKNGGQQSESSWPELSGADAMSQIPSLAKTDALDGHGGSMRRIART